jgi:Na+/proline symporter
MLCGLFGVGAIVTSLLVPHLGTHVFDIIITIAGALFGPLLAVFAMGMFVPRSNAPGAAIGLAAGAASLAAVFPTDVSPWWYGAFTCLPTFGVGVVSSLCFAAPNSERTRGLVLRLRPLETATTN